MGYEVQTGMLALNTGNNSKRLMRHNIMIQVSLSISKKKGKSRLVNCRLTLTMQQTSLVDSKLGKPC